MVVTVIIATPTSVVTEDADMLECTLIMVINIRRDAILEDVIEPVTTWSPLTIANFSLKSLNSFLKLQRL
jgi:hypothetical protein